MAPKISPEVRHKIQAFLELGWSYSVIINYPEKQNISISKGMISKINNKNGNQN